jgi:hypothetical protein
MTRYFRRLNLLVVFALCVGVGYRVVKCVG